MPYPKLVFSDFDGTLTLGDELRPEFFEVLSILRSKKVPLIICTGRSKSWAHFLLSHFTDLKYVITEGGGVLTYVEDSEGTRNLHDVLLIEEREVKKLENATAELMLKFPTLELTVDSFGRQTDRAIELSFLKNNPEIDVQVRDYLRSSGINFSTSNIHLNFWCGDVSKIKSIRYFLEHKVEDLSLCEDDLLFFGDSLNDESVFKSLKNCVGVSNIEKVKDRLEHLPTIVLEGKENRGILGVLNYLKSIFS